MISTCTAEFVVDIRGLSTDTKPTADNFAPLGHCPANGSMFIEMDTSKLYFYDAESDAWKEFSK